MAGALLLLWEASRPGGLSRFESAGLPIAVLLSLCWFLRLLAHVCVRGRGRRWFLLAPAGGAVVLSLLSVHAPLQARWALSEGAFTAAVISLPPAQPDGGTVLIEGPDRVGAFVVSAAFRARDGVMFETGDGCGIFGVTGFAWFLPHDDPQPVLVDRDLMKSVVIGDRHRPPVRGVSGRALQADGPKGGGTGPLQRPAARCRT